MQTVDVLSDVLFMLDVSLQGSNPRPLQPRLLLLLTTTDRGRAAAADGRGFEPHTGSCSSVGLAPADLP